mgnify:FL=1
MRKNNLIWMYLLDTDDKDRIEKFKEQLDKANKDGIMCIPDIGVKIKRICRCCGREIT